MKLKHIILLFVVMLIIMVILFCLYYQNNKMPKNVEEEIAVVSEDNNREEEEIANDKYAILPENYDDLIGKYVSYKPQKGRYSLITNNEKYAGTYTYRSGVNTSNQTIDLGIRASKFL